MTQRSLTCVPQREPLGITTVSGSTRIADLGELSTREPWDPVDKQALEAAIWRLLARAQMGLCRWNREVKPIRLFPDANLFEFRIDLEGHGDFSGHRIFFVESSDQRQITLIGSHLKSEGGTTSEERLAQNSSISIAYWRYLEAIR
jgi:hypothetical protein